MRKVLAKYKSVMLIATHYPIILQEIFAKNVKIVRPKLGNDAGMYGCVEMLLD